MNQHERERIYLRQYAKLPGYLTRKLTADAAEEAAAFFINRDELVVSEAALPELARLDERLAEALAVASDDWLELVDAWARSCEFADSPWWLAVRNRAGRNAEPATAARRP